jgi:hypothetical protein
MVALAVDLVAELAELELGDLQHLDQQLQVV